MASQPVWLILQTPSLPPLQVEVSAAELEKLQKANQNLQNEITQVQALVGIN